MEIVRVRLMGLDQVQAELRDVKGNQLPFAMMLAIRDTAYDAQKVVREQVLPQRFTLRRAAWMKRNIQVEQPTKQNLRAVVQDTFDAMKLQEKGGDKIPYGKAIAVPMEGARPRLSSLIDAQNRPAEVMAHGGFIRNGIMYAVALKAGRRGRVSRSVFGIQKAATWQRKIIPMYALVPRAKIKPEYGFRDSVVATANKNFKQNFEVSFAKAVRTAKK